MTHLDVALEFLDRFCAGDIDGLRPLLVEDLQFKGPLCHFDSREAYLNRLVFNGRGVD